MRNRVQPVQVERETADAHRVAPLDWRALGARVRQVAITAATLHLAERAAEKVDESDAKD